MTSPIFAPIIALVLWTFVMWVWLYATRIPAMFRLQLVYDRTQPNEAFLSRFPPEVRWKADNYNNLMEQPQLFYATAIVLALIGAGDGVNLWLAWGYVGLRVVHSLWQALFNIVQIRWALFMAASLVLLAMVVRAALAVF